MAYGRDPIGIYDLYGKVSHLVDEPNLVIDTDDEPDQNLENLPRLRRDLDSAIAWLEEQKRIVEEFLEGRQADQTEA